MSDLTALAQKLALLHSSDDAFDQGARVIAQGGVPAGMAAVIQAIDDTVLERQLEILTGTHLVTLIAAGRRLRGIANVVPPKGKSARLIGEPLSHEDGKTLGAVGELLSSLVDPAARLTLRSLPAQGFGKSGERGVTAATLAEVWNVDLNAAPLPPIARFLTGNASVISAYIHLQGGEIVATSGKITALEAALNDQLDAFLATRDKLDSAASGPQLLSLEGALAGDQALALAQAEDDTLLMAYDPAALGQVHAAWQAIFS